MDVCGGNSAAELERIADEELDGETDWRTADGLAKLNQLLDGDLELHSRRDKEFLLRFLRVCKYNVDKALQKVKAYYKIRKECTPIFENFVPSSAELAARSLVGVLPERDSHGRPVVLFKAGDWNPRILSYSEQLKAIVIVMEHLTTDPVAQTVGISCVLDYGGFTADKILSIDFGLLKKSLRPLLDCVPARIKAVHVVRESYAFDIAYALLRPFISKKITDRIHCHGQNIEGLQNDFPVDVLPEEYGGLKHVDFEAYWSGLCRAEEVFVENNRYGYRHETENCREAVEVTAF